MITPSPSYSLTLRLQLANRPGSLGRLATAIGMAGGDIRAVDMISVNEGVMVRDITVNASSLAHGEEIIGAVRGVDAVEIVEVADRTFSMHAGGKIEVMSRVALKTRDDLSMAYTPGVARICEAIHRDPARAFELTVKQNMVAVVTDGTAVLGLGDIGPLAAMPVMEGKAVLFKEFAGVDAFPICLNTRDPEEIVRVVEAISPGFGGINLEDISAPRCFIIEDRLKERLDIPVFHDDQHGTAVVVLAALKNALKLVDKRMADLKVVVSGVGAAGVACSKILMAAGVQNVIGCDRLGILSRQRNNLDWLKQWYVEHTNPEDEAGTIHDAIRGADVFLGLSAPGVIGRHDVARMARHPIVFAMSNPNPEIMPEEVTGIVAVMATGRSDYPNQINNVLAFPGIFRGALNAQASVINEEMKIAAANAIAGTIESRELHHDYIVPSVFDRRVASAVAAAVMEAAQRTLVARAKWPGGISGSWSESTNDAGSSFGLGASRH